MVKTPKKSRRRLKILGGIAACFLVLFIGLYVLMLHILETRTLVCPSNRKPSPQPAVMLQVGDNNNISCIYKPPRKKDGRVFIYSYGTGCQLADSMSLVNTLSARGYGVIAYDYEGFGSSDGLPRLANTLRDIEAVYQFLTGECGIAPAQIIALGYSMGTGPSAYLGARHPIGGVVLLAGFASLMQVKSHYSFWPGNKLPVCRWLAASDVPVILIHGTDDEVVPYRNAEYNLAAARGRKELITLPGVNHWLGDILEGVGAKRFFEIIEATF